MTNTPQIDPISAMVAVAAIAFAPEVAHFVGPYLVILFASTIGASFALAARPRMSHSNAAFFFFRVNGLAMLLTYSISAAINFSYPLGDMRNWFAIVAFIIGFIGDRWPVLLLWAGGKLSKLVDVLIKMRGDGGSRG